MLDENSAFVHQDLLELHVINKLTSVYHHLAYMVEHALTAWIIILVIVQVYFSMDQIVNHVRFEMKDKNRFIRYHFLANDDPTQSQRSAAFWSVFGVVCGLVALLTLSDLPWDEIAATIGCPWYRFKCCAKFDDIDDEDVNINNFHSTDSPTHGNNVVTKQMPIPGLSSRGNNYHIMNTVWNPEQLRNESPTNPQYNGYRSPDQHTTPDNVLIQSFAAVVMAKHKEKELEDKRVYAVDIIEQDNPTLKTKTAAETMVSWTQQLQEQLKNRPPRPTSENSTKELMQSEVMNEN